MTTSCFWPSDITSDGYCYGWSEPVLCVAGILSSQSVGAIQAIQFYTSHSILKLAEAERIAADVGTLAAPLVAHCASGPPKILGYFTSKIEADKNRGRLTRSNGEMG